MPPIVRKDQRRPTIVRTKKIGARHVTKSWRRDFELGLGQHLPDGLAEEGGATRSARPSMRGTPQLRNGERETGESETPSFFIKENVLYKDVSILAVYAV